MSATFKTKKVVWNKLEFDSFRANKIWRKLKNSFQENNFILLARQQKSYLVTLFLFFSDVGFEWALRR